MEARGNTAPLVLDNDDDGIVWLRSVFDAIGIAAALGCAWLISSPVDVFARTFASGHALINRREHGAPRGMRIESCRDQVCRTSAPLSAIDIQHLHHEI